MNSDQIYEGEWWIPENSIKLKGILEISQNWRLTLKFEDSSYLDFLSKLAEKKSRQSLVEIETILGKSKDIEITLLKCVFGKNRIQKDRDLTRLGGLPVFPLEAIIIGKHFRSLSEIKFQELHLKYNHLTTWVYDKNTENISPIKTIIDDVQISLFPNQDAYFHVKFNSEKNFKKCIEIEKEIRQFLNFFILNRIYLTEFKGLANNKNEVDIYIPNLIYASKEPMDCSFEFLVRFGEISGNFGEYLKKWFKMRKNKSMRDIIDIHIATRYFKDVPVQYNFLVHVFAIEKYHLIKCNEKWFNESMFEDPGEGKEWEKIKNQILKLINGSDITKDKKSSLKRKIESLNKKTLRRRIKDVINHFGLDFRQMLIGNSEAVSKFAKNVADARHKMVHSLESPSFEKLLKINLKLEIILRACILKELKFNEEKIVEISKRLSEKLKEKLEKTYILYDY